MIQKNEKFQRFSIKMILGNTVGIVNLFSLALVLVFFILLFGKKRKFLVSYKILPCYLTFQLS